MWKFTPSRVTTRTKRMQWLNTFRPYLFPADVMYSAVHRGDMDLVEWLHSCCKYETHMAMVEAAKAGQLPLIEWFSARHGTKINHIFPERRKWKGTEILVPLGTVGVVVWQTFHRRRGDNGQGSARCEHVATPHGYEEYEYEKGYRKPSPLLPFCSGPLYAAKHGDLSLIQRLHEDTVTPWQWSSNVMDVAAENGHLPILQWLHEHRSDKCSADAVYKAASNGHLEVLKWLDSVIAFDSIETELMRSHTTTCAAVRGRVEIAQWFYCSHPRLKTPVDVFLGYQYYYGNPNARLLFDIFRWYHAQDPEEYPVTIRHYYIAMKSHCTIDQIEWARVRVGTFTLNESCKWTDDSQTFLHDDLELIQYLNQLQEVPLIQLVNTALRSRHQPIFDHYFPLWQTGGGNHDDGRLLNFQSLVKASGFDYDWRVLAINMIERGHVDRACLKDHSFDSLVVPLEKRLAPLLGLQMDLRSAERLKRGWSLYFVLLHLALARKVDIEVGRWEKNVVEWAAGVGDMEFLRRIVEFKINCLSDIYLEPILRETKAADIVQIVHEKKSSYLDTRLTAWAARYACMHLLVYMFDSLEPANNPSSRQQFIETVVREGCQHGHTTMLDGLKGKVRSYAGLWKDTAIYAASNGQTGVLAWLNDDESLAQQSGLYDQSRHLWVAAVRGDHLNVLQWLHSHSVVMMDAKDQKYLVCMSIIRGHVSILRWLKQIFEDVVRTDARIRSEVAAFERKWSLTCW